MAAASSALRACRLPRFRLGLSSGAECCPPSAERLRWCFIEPVQVLSLSRPPSDLSRNWWKQSVRAHMTILLANILMACFLMSLGIVRITGD